MADLVSLFQGYDSFNVCPSTNTVVKGTTKTGNTESVCNYSRCTSVQDLQTALDVSVGIAASFGIGSGDAKSEFISQMSKSSTSVYVVVYSRYSITEEVDNSSLVQQFPSGESAVSWYYANGDSWVNLIKTGIEYFGVYSFQCTTVDEQTRVISSLEASGITEGGDVSANFQMNMQTAMQSIETNESFNQGCSGYNGAEPTSSEMSAFALSLPTLYDPADASVLYFNVTGYERVEGFPFQLFEEVRVSRGKFNQCSKSLAQISQQLNHAQQILNIYRTYGYLGDTGFLESQNKLSSDVGALNDIFTSMQTDPTTSQTIPTLNWPSVGSPEIQMKTVRKPIGGGEGGNSWQDMTPQSANQQMVLKTLTLWGGPLLNGVITSYVSATGQVANYQFGNCGESGDNGTTFNMGTSERISQISTTFGNDINSITVTTINLPEFTTGTTQTAPRVPDASSGTALWTMTNNATAYTCFLGFYGQSGSHIDAIGVTTLTFTPAVWTVPPLLSSGMSDVKLLNV